MEDFGEYTPPDSPLGRRHARRPRCTTATRSSTTAPAQRLRRRQPSARSARFIRSGWTGVAPVRARSSGAATRPPTGASTGSRSAVTNGAHDGPVRHRPWGSDIGGFFALGAQRARRRAAPPLAPVRRRLRRDAHPGERVRAAGQAAARRSGDADLLGNWRRYAKLRTQLYPYIAAADGDYRRSGHADHAPPGARLPRRRAAPSASDDEFLFGPDLLAAPVIEPGARERRLYLPRGRWVDLWRSASYGERHGRAAARRAASCCAAAATVTIPAPLDELPLLARAGTLLPLLPPDVDTLAAYGER